MSLRLTVSLLQQKNKSHGDDYRGEAKEKRKNRQHPDETPQR